jgi:hypothetical protein
MPFSLKMALNKYQIPAQKRKFEKIYTKNSIEHTFAAVSVIGSFCFACGLRSDLAVDVETCMSPL